MSPSDYRCENCLRYHCAAPCVFAKREPCCRCGLPTKALSDVGAGICGDCRSESPADRVQSLGRRVLALEAYIAGFETGKR